MLLICLAQHCIGVLHVPLAISSFDNVRKLNEINLKKIMDGPGIDQSNCEFQSRHT